MKRHYTITVTKREHDFEAVGKPVDGKGDYFTVTRPSELEAYSDTVSILMRHGYSLVGVKYDSERPYENKTKGEHPSAHEVKPVKYTVFHPYFKKDVTKYLTIEEAGQFIESLCKRVDWKTFTISTDIPEN